MVANLRSMFGMRLISIEGIILKYLPKKVAHSMKINSVDVSGRQLCWEFMYFSYNFFYYTLLCLLSLEAVLLIYISVWDPLFNPWKSKILNGSI